MLVSPVIIYMLSIKNIFLVSSECTVDLRHIKFFYYLIKSIFWDQLSLNFILNIYLLQPHSYLENGRGGPSLSMGKGLIPTLLMVQDPENSMELSSASPHYTCKSLISLIYSQVHLIVYMSID